jgi:hypothetical protein
MTKQQADDLMLQIMLWETAEASQHSINCLSTLTALCRHRDEVVYSRVLWYLPLEEVKRFNDMQTWGTDG